MDAKLNYLKINSTSSAGLSEVNIEETVLRMIPLSVMSQKSIFHSCTLITQAVFITGIKDNSKVAGILELTFHLRLVWTQMQRLTIRLFKHRIGTAALRCLTCGYKQELVIISHGWKIPEENLGVEEVLHSVLSPKTELLVQIPTKVKIQVQIWNI